MIRSKFRSRITEEDIIAMAAEAIDTAKKYGARSIGVNAEDASRTNLKFLVRFAASAREHSANRLRYCQFIESDHSSYIQTNQKHCIRTHPNA
jgi:citrate (Re)-synthase